MYVDRALDGYKQLEKMHSIRAMDLPITQPLPLAPYRKPVSSDVLSFGKEPSAFSTWNHYGLQQPYLPNEARHPLPPLIPTHRNTGISTFPRHSRILAPPHLVPRGSVPREPHVVPTIAFAPQALVMEKHISDDLAVMDTELGNADGEINSSVECTIELDDGRNLHSVSSVIDSGRKLYSGNRRRCLKYREKTRRQKRDNEKDLETLRRKNERLRSKHERITYSLRKLKEFYLKSLVNGSFKCKRRRIVKEEKPLVTVSEDGINLLNMDIKSEC